MTKIILKYFSIDTDDPRGFLREMDELCKRYATSKKKGFVYTMVHEIKREDKDRIALLSLRSSHKDCNK